MDSLIKLATIAISIRLGALMLFILIATVGIAVKLKDAFEFLKFGRKLRKISEESKRQGAIHGTEKN